MNDAEAILLERASKKPIPTRIPKVKEPNMKRERKSEPWLTSACVMLLLGASAVTQAQTTNFVVDQFDEDTSALFANQGWGTAVPLISWDSTLNKTTTLGPNTAGSGSGKWDIDWSANPPNDQVMVTRRFPSSAVLNLVNYTNISFDIRFDPASATDGNGTFGGVEVDWVPQADGWPSTYQGKAILYTTNSGWIHVEIPFDAASNPNLQAVTHVGFKIQQSGTGSALTGISTFWIDNVILHARAAAIPPPAVSLTPVTTPPGLMVMAPGGGNTYRRSMIRTLDSALGDPYYSWLGQGDTAVTYSLTIASYPKDHYYFQSQIFLVPSGGNDTSVDYNAATVIALDIRNLPDGTATAVFRYKTNHAYANASDYQPAVLVCSNGVLGTWSLTFLNDTNVSVKAPNGATTNFVLPEAAALTFNNPLSVYFGNMQNGADNAGQAATYSRVQVKGVALSPEIDETFAGSDLNPDPLNPKWRVVGDVPNCVFIVRADHKYWVNWSIPDSGFSLQSSPSLAPGSWTDPGLTNLVNTTLGNRLLIPQSSLPAVQSGYFRMVKPGL